MRVLITGGAGFAGSNLAILLKEKYPRYTILCLDNLKRRGSELNLPRLKKAGAEFIHGDIRSREDLFQVDAVDIILECSAEPSVTAGLDGSPDYLIQTNLMGTINCLEYARQKKAGMIFLSTSRVYPIALINQLRFSENETRFELEHEQETPGVSKVGFSEELPLQGPRSLYGATKLSSELMIEEYVDSFALKAIINRCGVLTGPWQMGKVDQGVIVHWIASHIFDLPLKYFGYGGTGKQVRDILHIKDLFRLIDHQVHNLNSLSGELFNVGGGLEISLSLCELTALVQQYAKRSVSIGSVTQDRTADIRIYLTDNSKVMSKTGWQPRIGTSEIIEEITEWVTDNKKDLEPIFKAS